MLRKQQEENPLPYELGAWEAFSKKRAATTGKKTAYWIAGIAASLALVLVAGGLWLSNDLEMGNALPSQEIALEEKLTSPDSEKSELSNSKDPEIEDSGRAEAINPVSKEEKGVQNKNSQSFNSSKEGLASNETIKSASTETIPKVPDTNAIAKAQQEPDKKAFPTQSEEAKSTGDLAKLGLQQSLIATQKRGDQEKEALKTEILEEKVITQPDLAKEPQLTEAEIEDILETPSFARLALGLSPGYGASQNSAQATSGSSLGFGVMIDKDIVGKLSIGSGLAVNYLNQASESQSYAQVAGFSSPVTEKNEIAQVQVDIPLYFKYPITRNNSISLQAGFSNLVTFNQAAETEFTYTRQVAVFNSNAAIPSNSFTLKSESASLSSDLNVPQNRFYPFATANLGVNFRLLESKKTSYEVMPFYNYPLQEFSGYGEKLGMFGASFKVNFGTIKR